MEEYGSKSILSESLKNLLEQQLREASPSNSEQSAIVKRSLKIFDMKLKETQDNNEHPEVSAKRA